MSKKCYGGAFNLIEVFGVSLVLEIGHRGDFVGVGPVVGVIADAVYVDVVASIDKLRKPLGVDIV